ncbi:MAG: hypothetical protein DRO18_00895 [Thermoprotei archaeon]|nr:MAG: hypothetical protein DRO18_00895 [Thermoprotei archaeon]
MRRTLTSVVWNIITSRPSILTCLAKGLINYSALARDIVRDVEREVGVSGVNVNTIKVILIRLSNKLRSNLRSIEDQILHILARSALRLETDLVVLTINREYIQPKIAALVQELRNARFLQVTQGINTYTIVLAKEIMNKALSIIGEKAPYELIDDQSAIILISPREILTTPGFVSYVTGLLAWSGINITQIISCHLDTILIVSTNDVMKAYTVLQSVITSARKFLTK